MAPAEGRNLRNKLFSTILAVVFMIKIFTSSQVYRLPIGNLLLLFNIAFSHRDTPLDFFIFCLFYLSFSKKGIKEMLFYGNSRLGKQLSICSFTVTIACVLSFYVLIPVLQIYFSLKVSINLNLGKRETKNGL